MNSCVQNVTRRENTSARSKIVTDCVIVVVSSLALLAVNLSRQRSTRPNALPEVAANVQRTQQDKATTAAKRVEEKLMESIELLARLEKLSGNRFEPAQPIVVLLLLKNQSNRSIDFTETASVRDFDLRVQDAQGNEMPVTKYGYKRQPGEAQASSATRLTSLQPCQAMQFKFVLKRAIDMTQDGVYLAIIRRSFFSDGKFGNYAESNPMRIVVASTEPAMVGTLVPDGAAGDS